MWTDEEIFGEVAAGYVEAEAVGQLRTFARVRIMYCRTVSGLSLRSHSHPSGLDPLPACLLTSSWPVAGPHTRSRSHVLIPWRPGPAITATCNSALGARCCRMKLGARIPPNNTGDFSSRCRSVPDASVRAQIYWARRHAACLSLRFFSSADNSITEPKLR